MFLRSILPVAAVFALAVAGPAAAQTRLTTQNGLGSVTLPAGMDRHPLGGDSDDTLSLVVRRPGQTGFDFAGLCMISIGPPANAPSMETWTALSALYYVEAESKARARVEKKGGVFERMLANKDWTSKTGWAGWFSAYQTKNAEGEAESSVFAGTQLAANNRVTLSCTSSNGEGFSTGDLDLIYKLAQSAST